MKVDLKYAQSVKKVHLGTIKQQQIVKNVKRDHLLMNLDQLNVTFVQKELTKIKPGKLNVNVVQQALICHQPDQMTKLIVYNVLKVINVQNNVQKKKKIALKEDIKMTQVHLNVSVVIKDNKIVKQNNHNVKNAQLEHKELKKKEFQ